MGVYQQIREKFITKNAWEDWADYRRKLTNLILRTEPESIMIIGAGRCNDIDLGSVTARVDRAVLLDMDKEAIQDATASLPKEQRDKVSCIMVSLTGIGEGDLNTFFDKMLSRVRSAGMNLTVESFRGELMSGMDGLADKLLKREEDLTEVLPESDVIVCCGVHSQFFSQLSFFIRSLLHSLQEILPGVEVLEDEVNRRIRSMDDQIVPAINRALCKAAGKILIFGNEFMPDSPVEGAHQCISDVREHFTPEEIHLLWDFNRAEEITYDMLIQVCNVV